MDKKASITLIENHMPSSGIGNYKGVMLCNRPFAGTAATTKASSSADKTSFAVGVVSDPLGIGSSQIPAILNLKGKLSGRKKKISVVTKHKKWLDELQKTKEELELQEEEEKNQKKLDLEKFMDREARIRQQRKRDNKSNNADDDKDNSNENDDNHESKSDSKSTKNANESKDSKLEKSQKKGSTNNKAKPKWAVSESDAKDVDSDMFDDDEDLLAYVDGLDFKRYAKDTEIQSTMDKIKLRIAELENEIETDIKYEKERKVERDKLKKYLQSTNSSNPEDDEEDDDEYEPALDDTRSEADDKDKHLFDDAKKLLRNSKYYEETGDDLYDLEAVHSKRSIASMLKTMQEKKEDKKPVVFNEPVIVSHESYEGDRLQVKAAIDKLPYMHRNPSV